MCFVPLPPLTPVPKPPPKPSPSHRSPDVPALKCLTLTFSCSESITTGNLVDLCGRTLTVDGLTLRSHRESKKYYFVGLDADCWLSVRASSAGERLAFTFRYFLVYSLIRITAFPEPTLETHSAAPPVAGPDPCHAGSFIQFYDGDGPLAAPLGPPLCGKTIPEPVKSSGIALTLRLVTRGKLPRVDFIGDFTSFTLGPCVSHYFRCRNGRCIPWSLVCDTQRVDNCGDGSDQSLLFPDDTCPANQKPLMEKNNDQEAANDEKPCEKNGDRNSRFEGKFKSS
uniref:low-density lipoprotein receptor class A domain-containing protein 2 n=1 Tax=Myxine glutinosa TaxID=7769 RepID=UPI00358F4A69